MVLTYYMYAKITDCKINPTRQEKITEHSILRHDMSTVKRLGRGLQGHHDNSVGLSPSPVEVERKIF